MESDDGKAEDGKAAGEELGEAPEAPQEEPKAKRAKPARATPLSEKDIDSPDRRTLLLLGVVFVVTAASWGSARLACNYHPPQSRSAPTVRTDELARSPKDAAIEFAHRFRTRNYEGALELARPPLTADLEKERARCEEQGPVCPKERGRLEQSVLTAAIVKEQAATTAVTEVTHHVGPVTERIEIKLERDGPLWKAVSRKPL